MCCQIIEEVLSFVEILEMDLKVLLNIKLHIMPFLLWRKCFVCVYNNSSVQCTRPRKF